MKVLWLCNIALPVIAESLSMPVSNKEGWLTGLSDSIIQNKAENQIELAVAFPTLSKGKVLKGKAGGLLYYAFYENTAKEAEYSTDLEKDMKEILEGFRPDIVHIFGTEFAHSLAMVKSYANPQKTLVGIQGICSVCAIHYADGIPEKVKGRYLLRDFLKQDNIKKQQQKFIKRGERENEILRSTGNITGRTAFDKEISCKLNETAKYYFMNETLRSNFYKEEWRFMDCVEYTVFVSQGDYPLKGLHRVLEALEIVKKEYPEVRLKVAGNKITANESLYQKIKISSYGKYILDLINKKRLQENVSFVGMLNAVQMCEELKRTHVFVNASSVENSPNSLGEAMLLGVPCIAAKVGGIPSMLTHEKEGYLYEANDTQKLAAYIMRVFQNKEETGHISKAASLRAHKTHDAEENYKSLMKIYQSILGD